MKAKNLILTTGLLFAASSAYATPTVIFDGNNGGTAKAGSVETGTGTMVGTDVQGDPLGFSDFDVTAGTSTGINLAGSSFTYSTHIVTDSYAYQDITPSHGGLGAFSPSVSGSGACNTDTDNLEPNLETCSTGDEILFFNFDSSVILNKVWFNGPHEENTAFTNNGGFDNGDTLFNIFYSLDGENYTSVFGSQQAPTAQEYLATNLTDAYQYYGVTASGWSNAPGGYVEAISYTKVSEPSTLALVGLGFLGLGVARRRLKRQA